MQEADIRIKKETKKFLIKEKIWGKFVVNVLGFTWEEPYPMMRIDNSFSWRKSLEGHQFWSNCYKKYNKSIKKNK